MKTIFYFHGFNSNGNAFKANLLRQEFPEVNIESPTFDFYKKSPFIIFKEITDILQSMPIDLIIGSSLGGYYSICCADKWNIPILLINPVTNPIPVIRNLLTQAEAKNDEKEIQEAIQQLKDYQLFQTQVFDSTHVTKPLLNFALSTDDEVLGDHDYLEEMFPIYNHKVIRDHCGHHFEKFKDLYPTIRELLQM